MTETSPRYLLQPFDLRTTSALIEAFTRAYPAHIKIRDGFKFQEFAKMPAGHQQAAQVKDHLMAGRERIGPNLQVAMHKVPRSPHYFVTLSTPDLILEVVPSNKGPRPGKLPKLSKYRTELAAKSMIVPSGTLVPLPGFDNHFDFPPQTMSPYHGERNYAFGAIVHYPDPGNRSRMGALEVVLVDRNYQPVHSLDLLQHAQDLRVSATSIPKVVPFPVQIKKTES